MKTIPQLVDKENITFNLIYMYSGYSITMNSKYVSFMMHYVNHKYPYML